MPPIQIAVFQNPVPGSNIRVHHWGLFVPHRTAAGCANPPQGDLFHAMSELGTCCFLNGGVTRWERLENFVLSVTHHQTLVRSLVLNGTDNVTAGQVGQASGEVSAGRSFHPIINNCQDWVNEVLSYLVEEGTIPNSVFDDMKRVELVPLSNNGCVKCIRSSLSLNCKCRQRIIA